MFDDVAYLRSQALMRLNMARQMSDPDSAERCREEAKRLTLRAERLEEEVQQPKPNLSFLTWKD